MLDVEGLEGVLAGGALVVERLLLARELPDLVQERLAPVPGVPDLRLEPPELLPVVPLRLLVGLGEGEATGHGVRRAGPVKRLSPEGLGGRSAVRGAAGRTGPPGRPRRC